MSSFKSFQNQVRRAETDFFRLFNDLFTYTAADWTITTTEAGAGAATEAIGAGSAHVGGVLVITNDDADNDADFLQRTGAGEPFQFVVGKKLYFETRLKVSDATNCDLVAGLQITDTTPLAVSDGIFFRKDDDATEVTLVVCKNGTESEIALGNMADDTWARLGFYYDGTSSRIVGLLNGVAVASLPLTNAPDDEQLTVSYGIVNGAAAAKVLSIDYFDVIQER